MQIALKIALHGAPNVAPPSALLANASASLAVYPVCPLCCCPDSSNGQPIVSGDPSCVRCCCDFGPPPPPPSMPPPSPPPPGSAGWCGPDTSRMGMPSQYPVCVKECAYTAGCLAVRWLLDTGACELMSKCATFNAADLAWRHGAVKLEPGAARPVGSACALDEDCASRACARGDTNAYSCPWRCVADGRDASKPASHNCPRAPSEPCEADRDCALQACDTGGLYSCHNRCVQAERDSRQNAQFNCGRPNISALLLPCSDDWPGCYRAP
jgi:hypothetical protein